MVIWVPHPDLADEYQTTQMYWLGRRAGMFEVGDDWQLGEIDDGWLKVYRVWNALIMRSTASKYPPG